MTNEELATTAFERMGYTRRERREMDTSGNGYNSWVEWRGNGEIRIGDPSLDDLAFHSLMEGSSENLEIRRYRLKNDTQWECAVAFRDRFGKRIMGWGVGIHEDPLMAKGIALARAVTSPFS